MSRVLQSAVTFRDAWDTPLDLNRFQLNHNAWTKLISGSRIVLSSTARSYLTTPGQFLLSVLTLVPSLVGDICPFY